MGGRFLEDLDVWSGKSLAWQAASWGCRFDPERILRSCGPFARGRGSDDRAQAKATPKALEIRPGKQKSAQTL